MFEYAVEELARISDGQLISGEESLSVSGFFVDSRVPIHNGVFVATRGKRVDGHQFLFDVQSSGAGVAIIEDSYSGDLPHGLACIVVPDSVVALGKIAHWTRVNKLSAKVIAVTGSSGKTTTKDFIAGILTQCGPTVWSSGSFNTEVGLPLTLLSAERSTKYLVLEMGMRGLGQIADLAHIAVPDIGIVTNVGLSHVGILKTQENIATAKSELIRSLGSQSLAILNVDDPYVRAMSQVTDAQIVSFGESSTADYQAVNVELSPTALSSFTLKFNGESHEVRLKIPGEHQVSNALAAIAAVNSAGIGLADACSMIGNIEHISKWRMEVITTDRGLTVINDTYNANPESMRAALKTLASMSKGRRSIAVLGPMLELGERSVEEHDSLGRLVVRLDISLLLCVGAPMKITHLGASQEGSWGDEAHWVPNVEAAIEFLSRTLMDGDVVLVKASRAIGLDHVAEVLISGDFDAAAGDHSNVASQFDEIGSSETGSIEIGSIETGSIETE